MSRRGEGGSARAVLLTSTVDKQRRDRRKARCMIYSDAQLDELERDRNAQAILTFIALCSAI